MTRQPAPPDRDSPALPAEAGPAVPAWAFALDVLTVVLALLAFEVLLFRGFRFEVLDTRVSVTSWIRPLFWAALLTVVRHAVVPRPSLPHIARGWIHGERPGALRAVAPAFVISRVAVLFVGLVAVHTIGLPVPAPFRVSPDETLNLLARWDTGWFLGIAQDGYSATGPGQQNIVFFPLYPLLMRWVGAAIGGHPLVAGFLVSLAAFLGALVYVYRLGLAWCEREGNAGMAVALLAFYPFAIFFGVVYTEALFLLCAAGAIYHVRRRQVVAATLWAFAAGLTRSNGMFLSVPLAILVLSGYWPDRPLVRRHLAGDRLATPASTPSLAHWIPVIAPVAGLSAYSAYVYSLTGHPFAWASYQSAWGREYEGLFALVSEAEVRLSHHGLVGAIKLWPFSALNAMAAILGLVSIWPVTRRYGLALGAFVALNVLVPLLVGGTLSMGRFTSVLFPIFFWIADSVPPARQQYWFAAFGVGQGLAACLFFTWYQLF